MLAEKDQWLKDKAKMDSVSNPKGQVVDLNIGGSHQMTCSIDVLKSDKGSDLEKLFSGDFKHKVIDGKVFLDRDGDTFKQVLNFLRNGGKQMGTEQDGERQRVIESGKDRLINGDRKTDKDK